MKWNVMSKLLFFDQLLDQSCDNTELHIVKGLKKKLKTIFSLKVVKFE